MRDIRVDLIITTACGDPLAWDQWGSATRTPHKERARILREKVLPSAVGFDSVIVVGRCDESALGGFDVTYIHLPPLRRDRSEALRQREAATRWSSADILVYCCDDHMLGVGFAETLRDTIAGKQWDVLTPKRLHGITGAELNNGREGCYTPFHTNVFRRWVWAKVPFTAVDVIASDRTLTKLYQEAGAKLIWDDRLYCVDCEVREGEV